MGRHSNRFSPGIRPPNERMSCAAPHGNRVPLKVCPQDGTAVTREEMCAAEITDHGRTYSAGEGKNLAEAGQVPLHVRWRESNARLPQRTRLTRISRRRRCNCAYEA